MNTPPEATLLYRSSTHVYIYTYIHTYTNAIVFSPNTRPEATCTYPSQHSTAKSSSSTTANQWASISSTSAEVLRSRQKKSPALLPYASASASASSLRSPRVFYTIVTMEVLKNAADWRWGQVDERKELPIQNSERKKWNSFSELRKERMNFIFTTQCADRFTTYGDGCRADDWALVQGGRNSRKSPCC